MNNFNPLATLDHGEFSLLLAETVKYIVQVLKKEDHDRRDKNDMNSSSELDFIVQLTSNPSFGIVAPARQVAWRTRLIPGVSSSVHGNELQIVFDEIFEHMAMMESNKSEGDIFIEWARSINKGITAPFDSLESPAFVDLSQVYSDHAIQYEFEFMGSIQSNLKFQTEQTHTHLSIIKALGLWTWYKAKKLVPDNQFLRTPLRSESIFNLLLTTYNHNIPVIWGMATEKLSSSTQMTFLGLRIFQDSTIFSATPTIHSNKEIFYSIACDYAESQAEKQSLFLKYKNQKPNTLRDWTRQNIKDGLESIGNNAIDVCLEIGERLYSCECGSESIEIRALSKLANSQIDEPTKKRRLAFRIFARDYVQKISHQIPPDMLEPPLIFNHYEDLFPREIYQMCSYVAHWWTQKCNHSPAEEDIRQIEERLGVVGDLLHYLESETNWDVINEDFLKSTKGKTIPQIIKTTQNLLKQKNVFIPPVWDQPVLDWPSVMDQLDLEWPRLKGWDSR